MGHGFGVWFSAEVLGVGVMADFFPAVLRFRLVSCGCGVALSLEELNPRWRSSMWWGLRLKVSGYGFRVE